MANLLTTPLQYPPNYFEGIVSDEPINTGWLTISEVAQRTGLSASRIRQLVNGKPPIVKSELRAGRRWIHESELVKIPAQGIIGRPRKKSAE